MLQNHHPLVAWLILHLAPQFSPRHWKKCFELFSSPTEFCQLPEPQLRALGLASRTIAAILAPEWSLIDTILAWQAHPHHTLLTYHDPAYPAALKHIHTPPPLLYVIGDTQLLQRPQLAMVGSRQPSPMGLRLAKLFAEQLSQSGLIVTSGLALGIDAQSHLAALTTGAATIAVLGTGVNMPYPRQNRLIYDKIRDNGAIVSELPLSSPPRSQHFPQRNRLISGLSLGTLVIEASLRSGSLITARLAMEQGREVFALPGSIMNPLSSGCHYLIQQGAKLVTCLTDIFSELNLTETKPHTTTPTTTGTQLDNDHQKLLECIGYDMIKFEQLVDETGFPEQKVTALLCQLLLNGYIKEALGGYSRVS